MRFTALFAALVVTVALAPSAEADPITQLAGLSLNDPLPDAQFYSFVPGTLGRGNWASEQLRTLRSGSSRRLVSLEQAHALRSNLVFTNDPLAGTDSIEEPVTADPMAIALEGTASVEDLLYGETGFRDALVASGLGLADLQDELPELALATGSFYGMLANEGRELMSALGRFLGLDRKLDGMRLDVETTATADKKSKDERKRRSTGEHGSEAPDRPEVTLKQVVRSTFKIILGALLGALMFVLVRRRAA